MKKLELDNERECNKHTQSKREEHVKPKRNKVRISCAHFGPHGHGPSVLAGLLGVKPFNYFQREK